MAQARHHNMAVSLGILALVAITSGLMVVTTQRAQRLARQQIEFVAGVTHELHTPLTAIRSAGQNLADGVVADAQQVRRYGSLIEREGRRLTDLVGQVLELAGIQSGRRVYEVRPEDVDALVDGALEDCRVLLDEKKVRVEREIPPDLPPVLADGAALRRALRNLIENAVRHGGTGRLGRPAGPGRRRKGSRSRWPTAGRASGARTSPTSSSRSTAAGRDADGVPGSGLGLSVVRHVVEALGGTGERGVRRGRRRERLHPAPARGPLRGNGLTGERRILLVEDEPSLALTVSDRLLSEGYQVETAGDGDTALARALAEPFDLVILDVMLPGRDGFEVCRELRSRGWQVPVLMLTARSQVVDRVVGLKLGADDYLTKPFEMIELLARVEALLRRSRGAAPAAPAGTYAFGDVRVDFRRAEVFRGDEPVPLSALEFKLLAYFIENRGALLTRDELLDKVWGYDAMPVTRTVDVHVGSLRQKLERNPSHPELFLTVHRRGYRFTAG